jgi:ParB family chromosome partitioning protein
VAERALTVHQLDIDARFFGAVASGKKPFEVRRDRGYRVGDILELHEWVGAVNHALPIPNHPQGYWQSPGYPTGRKIRRLVTYVLRHEDFPQGIAEGYCVLGLREAAE